MSYEDYTKPPEIVRETRKWELHQVYLKTNGNHAAVHRANAAFATNKGYGHREPCQDDTVNGYLRYWDKWYGGVLN